MRCHLQALPLGRRTLADYGDSERLRALAEPLRGLRVLHLTAAGSRLRSPEILPSLLSLHRDLGLEGELWALAGERPLWQLVRELEDGLQGAETAISDEAWNGYLEGARSAVAGRLGDWDVRGRARPRTARRGHRRACPGGAPPRARRLPARARRVGAPGAAGRGLRGAVAAVGRLRPARAGGKGGRGSRGDRPFGPGRDRAAGGAWRARCCARSEWTPRGRAAASCVRSTPGRTRTTCSTRSRWPRRSCRRSSSCSRGCRPRGPRGLAAAARGVRLRRRARRRAAAHRSGRPGQRRAGRPAADSPRRRSRARWRPRPRSTTIETLWAARR